MSVVATMGFIVEDNYINIILNGCEWVKSVKQNAGLRWFLTEDGILMF